MFRALRKQLGSIVTGALLLAIAMMVSYVVVYPREVIDAFGMGGEEMFFPLMLTAAIVASACFLIVAWWMFAWLFRSLRSFRQFDRAAQGTVAVEFMLVLPVLMYLFGTVFQMAEIAHAQLVFRYSAFSAARSAAVSEHFLHFPLPGGGMIYSISKDDKQRARTAAVIPLTGIYTPEKMDDPVGGCDTLDIENLSHHYWKASEDKSIQDAKKSVWLREGFFKQEFKKANSALRNFHIKCEYSKLFKGNLRNMLKSELKSIAAPTTAKGNSVLKTLKTFGLDLKLDLQSTINSAIDKIIDEALDKTGLDKVLDTINDLPNPISPPMVSVQMEYHLKLRPASFFRLIKANDPYIRLKRVAKNTTRGSLEPLCPVCGKRTCAHRLLMQTTGGRIDMPILPPLIKKVNFMFGDCTH